jgi:hypothetical protein
LVPAPAAAPYRINFNVDPSAFRRPVEMGDFILRYQGIEQVTGNIIKTIFPGPVDNSNKWHSASPKSQVHPVPESGLFFPFHAIFLHESKNARLIYFAQICNWVLFAGKNPLAK